MDEYNSKTWIPDLERLVEGFAESMMANQDDGYIKFYPERLGTWFSLYSRKMNVLKDEMKKRHPVSKNPDRPEHEISVFSFSHIVFLLEMINNCCFYDKLCNYYSPEE